MLLNLPFQKGHNADFIFCAYSFHIRIPKIHKTSLTQWKEIISQDNHTNWDVLMRGNIKDTNCIWKLALFRVLRIFEIRFFESKGVFQGDSLHEYKREWNDFTHMYIEIQLMVENIYSNMLFMQKNILCICTISCCGQLQIEINGVKKETTLGLYFYSCKVILLNLGVSISYLSPSW